MRNNVRRFFHWKFSGVLIPVFIGLAGLMVSVAASLAETQKWLFILGYIFFVLAVLWSVGYWLTSGALQKRNPRTWNRNKRRSCENLKDAEFLYQTWKWGGCLACLAGLLSSVLFVNFVWDKKELANYDGPLLPADDPIPDGPCHPTGNELALYIGPGAIKSGVFPLRAVAIQHKTVMTIDRTPSGNLLMSVDVTSSDGKIIARIDNNVFTVNPNNILSRKHPDRSTLIVVDQTGQEVLNARYMNPHTFRFTGVLRNGNVVENLEADNRTSGNCFQVTKGTTIGEGVLEFHGR